MADEEQHDDEQNDEQNDDEQNDDGAEEELEAIRSDPASARKTIKALSTEAGDYRRKLRKAELELERARTEGLSEQERAVAEAELRGRQEASAEHGRKLLEAQLRAAAAGKLQDPGDALRYLDLEALLDEELDDRELAKRVDRLVEDKPYLAVANGDAGGKRVGVRSQGARTAPGGTKEADADGSAWLRKAARKSA
jgi:hypothetical protein